jgi:serine/threonine protein kinase
MAKKLPSFETPFESYVATGIIGEGGAGRVYEVLNSANEQFALKCLVPERVTSERIKRFKNEIEFCQRQTHINIIRVIDTGIFVARDVKCPFYVMQRYSGTLRNLIGSLKPEEILRLFSQILDGVEAAHLARVWHRDLKPENVLFGNKEKSAVIADFGIAHFEEDEIYTAVETKVAARMANFQYSAPEQRVRGAVVDRRADIFALGLILNEMFTGAVLHGVGYKKIGGIHGEYQYLDDLVEQMVQQDPSKRPESIEAIKKELIGRKLAFVSLQQLDEAKKKVVPTAKPLEFSPISIVGLDFEGGVLHLKLNRSIPSGWAQEFQQQRGGHSSVMGYGPENFSFNGDVLSIGRLNNEESLVQRIVDHAKNYVNSANRFYEETLRNRAVEEERRQREILEKRVAEAELRKNILARVKL